MTRPEPVDVTTETLRGWPLPEPGSEKHARGTVIVLGGCAGTPGAVLLAGESALRAGAGRLQLATVESVAAALAVAVPEAAVEPLPEDPSGAVGTTASDRVLQAAEGADAVLIGPGFSDTGKAVALLERVVPHLDTSVVVDGLASAYLTEHPDGLRHLAGRCVLTVNPTELARVLDRDDESVGKDPVGAALDAAERTGAVVLCGGESKSVATPDGDCWIVGAGGPGMAVSGSGDVQAGLVAGLVARGADPSQAAVWGASLHGRAGERLAAAMGTVGFLARELHREVPALLRELG